METNQKTTFIKGAAILAIAGLICKLLGVFIRIFAVRIIGEKGMFYYEVVFPTYSWLLIISSSGIPTAISRLVAERVSVGNYYGARRVFRWALLLLTLIGAATSGLMFFAAPWLGETVLNGGEGAKYAMMALAPALLFVSMMCAFRGYLQGLQQMTGTSVSQFTEQIFKMIFGLLLAWLLFRKFSNTDFCYAAGATGLLLGVTISEILSLFVIIIFYVVARIRQNAIQVPLQVESGKSDLVFGRLIVIAIPITLGASILPIANVLDSVMIKRLLEGIGFLKDDAELNYTALCTYVRSIINMPATLTVGISMSVVPAISAARARGDHKNVRNLSLLSLKIAMAIGLPCAVGLSVLAGPIIKLLYSRITPEAFAIAEPLMQVAAFTVIFISLVQTSTGALQGAGKHWLPMIFLLIGGVTKIIVNFIFIPMKEINILGAVFSNLACFGVAGILDTISLLRVTKAKINMLDTFLKPILASALMGGAAWGVQMLLSSIESFKSGIMSRVATVVAILVAVVVYASFTLLFAMFTKEELTYIPGGRKLARFARR